MLLFAAEYLPLLYMLHNSRMLHPHSIKNCRTIPRGLAIPIAAKCEHSRPYNREETTLFFWRSSPAIGRAGALAGRIRGKPSLLSCARPLPSWRQMQCSKAQRCAPHPEFRCVPVSGVYSWLQSAGQHAQNHTQHALPHR